MPTAIVATDDKRVLQETTEIRGKNILEYLHPIHSTNISDHLLFDINVISSGDKAACL